LFKKYFTLEVEGINLKNNQKFKWQKK
jgi:hypothetical protein